MHASRQSFSWHYSLAVDARESERRRKRCKGKGGPIQLSSRLTHTPNEHKHTFTFDCPLPPLSLIGGRGEMPRNLKGKWGVLRFLPTQLRCEVPLGAL